MIFTKCNVLTVRCLFSWNDFLYHLHFEVLEIFYYSFRNTFLTYLTLLAKLYLFNVY